MAVFAPKGGNRGGVPIAELFLWTVMLLGPSRRDRPEGRVSHEEQASLPTVKGRLMGLRWGRPMTMHRHLLVAIRRGVVPSARPCADARGVTSATRTPMAVPSRDPIRRPGEDPISPSAFGSRSAPLTLWERHNQTASCLRAASRSAMAPVQGLELQELATPAAEPRSLCRCWAPSASAVWANQGESGGRRP